MSVWTPTLYVVLGDLTLLTTVVGLLGYMWRKQISNGISGRTQILMTLVFTTRYLDLFFTFYSVYYTVMKVAFVSVGLVTVLTIYCKYKDPNRKLYDTFRHETLIVGAGIIALFVHYDLTLTEVFWAFSEYLEVVAIIPQLHMISKAGKSEKVVDVYLFGLSQYRMFYVMNYAFRYFYDNTYNLVAVVPGILQILIYLDYFLSLLLSQMAASKAKNACQELNPIQPVYVVTSKDLPPYKALKENSPSECKVVQDKSLPPYEAVVDQSLPPYESLEVRTGPPDKVHVRIALG